MSWLLLAMLSCPEAAKELDVHAKASVD